MQDTYTDRRDIPGKPVIGFAQMINGREYTIRRIDGTFYCAFNELAATDTRRQLWRIYGPFHTPRHAAACGQEIGSGYFE
jgi:hypothetical protein